MRAMFLEFPEDRTTHHLDKQFMLGPSLLVAPVFVPEGEETEYYLPVGRWTSYFHPERVVNGPTWIREVVPIDELPVWVRPNTVLALGPPEVDRPDYVYNEKVEIQVYEADEGKVLETDIPTGQSNKIAGKIRVESNGAEVKLQVVEGSVEFARLSVLASGALKSATVESGEDSVSLKL
jgi:alpha-glucosidase (family GH31 glycosyl hydrolase)